MKSSGGADIVMESTRLRDGNTDNVKAMLLLILPIRQQVNSGYEGLKKLGKRK